MNAPNTTQMPVDAPEQDAAEALVVRTGLRAGCGKGHKKPPRCRYGCGGGGGSG